MARKLTAKQEAYKNNRIAGMGVSESYRSAYNASGMSDKAVSKEADLLEKDPRITPAIKVKRKEAATKALVTAEDIVKGLLKETDDNAEGSTSAARTAAWKALSDYTGGFDNNRQKVHNTNVGMTQEQWLDSLDD